MPRVSVVPITAICTAVMVITAGVMNVSKKSSVRISMVSHGPDVAAWFLDGVLAYYLIPCGKRKSAQHYHVVSARLQTRPLVYTCIDCSKLNTNASSISWR